MQTLTTLYELYYYTELLLSECMIWACMHGIKTPGQSDHVQSWVVLIYYCVMGALIYLLSFALH